MKMKIEGEKIFKRVLGYALNKESELGPHYILVVLTLDSGGVVYFVIYSRECLPDHNCIRMDSYQRKVTIINSAYFL